VIVVVGGTGNVGREVVRGLCARGEKVRVFARARQPVPDGVELVSGDLADLPALEGALAGADRAFVVSSPDPRAAELQGNAFDTAARVGVRHVVRSSVLDASHDSPARLLRMHAEAEDRLLAAGTTWTIVRPNLFLQFVLGGYAPEQIKQITSQGVLLQPAGEGRVSMVDRRDLAAVAVTALTCEGHEGRRYDVTGPEALTMGELAQKLSAHLGRKVTQADPPLAQFAEQLAGFGLPAFLTEGLVELYQLFRDGYPAAAQVTDAVEVVTGCRARSTDDVIAELF
jgi:uncharacterized protein YbjT (DUF2867 family)